MPWRGTYYGVINCANCGGINMELTLTKGNKYILSTKEVNRRDSAYIQKGTFFMGWRQSVFGKCFNGNTIYV